LAQGLTENPGVRIDPGGTGPAGRIFHRGFHVWKRDPQCIQRRENPFGKGHFGDGQGGLLFRQARRGVPWTLKKKTAQGAWNPAARTISPRYWGPLFAPPLWAPCRCGGPPAGPSLTGWGRVASGQKPQKPHDKKNSLLTTGGRRPAALGCRFGPKRRPLREPPPPTTKSFCQVAQTPTGGALEKRRLDWNPHSSPVAGQVLRTLGPMGTHPPPILARFDGGGTLFGRGILRENLICGQASNAMGLHHWPVPRGGRPHLGPDDPQFRPRPRTCAKSGFAC